MTPEQIHQALIDIANVRSELLRMRDTAHAKTQRDIDEDLAALAMQRGALLSLVAPKH